MFELIYRYDPSGRQEADRPESSEEAIARLVAGNRRLASAVDSLGGEDSGLRNVVPLHGESLGIPEQGASGPAPQKPFAALLSCADARVSPELVFLQPLDSLFTVRVAGNVAASEQIGSLAFAASGLRESLRLIVVLGHSDCGGVGGAVDAYLDAEVYRQLAPTVGLSSILDRVLTAVRIAAEEIDRAGAVEGGDPATYRSELVRISTVLNAAQTAMSIQELIGDLLVDDLRVVYGVYDLESSLVRCPTDTGANSVTMRPGLAEPPTTGEELERLAASLANGALD